MLIQALKYQRMAILICSFNAIASVFFAPFIKCLVTSLPVTCLRIVLSGQVSKTCPLRLFVGGRGVGRPPNVSGHTDMILIDGLLVMYFLTG